MKMRTRTKRGDLAANASLKCSLWLKARRRTIQSLAKRAVNAVITDLKGETLKSAVECSVSPDTTAVMDNFASHSTVEKAVSKSERQTVRGCNAPKVLPWVHIAISNAKSLFTDMYHGIKEEFLQEYLNEFCYKFNRKYFGDRMFDRLVIAAVSYKPTFEHKLYNGRANCG